VPVLEGDQPGSFAGEPGDRRGWNMVNDSTKKRHGTQSVSTIVCIQGVILPEVSIIETTGWSRSACRRSRSRSRLRAFVAGLRIEAASHPSAQHPHQPSRDASSLNSSVSSRWNRVMRKRKSRNSSSGQECRAKVQRPCRFDKAAAWNRALQICYKPAVSFSSLCFFFLASLPHL
jgi:hypothetical protein